MGLFFFFFFHFSVEFPFLMYYLFTNCLRRTCLSFTSSLQTLNHIRRVSPMASINKVILIGNLGRDPELRYTPQGKPVVNFSMATTERWTGKDGEKQTRTEWHKIVLWGRQAEIANQYLKKGNSCMIEGRITTRSWEDKDKNKRYSTEIEGLQLHLLSGGGGGGGGDRNEPPHQQTDEYFDSYPDPMGGGGGAMPDSGPSSGGGGSADDDLPF
jgi:single-strand DNA-binding protein